MFFVLQFSNLAYCQKPGIEMSSLPWGGSVSLDAATGSIRGEVRSGSKPVVGATVRLLGLDRVSYTDGAGEFRFRDVPNGAYKVFVRCIGYASATNTVHVLQHSPWVIYIEAAGYRGGSSGSIRGTLRSSRER